MSPLRAGLLAAGFAVGISCGGNVDLGGSCPTCDGGVGAVDCSGYIPPGTSAKCGACSHGAKDCQPNGCYNGWYCLASSHDCLIPPMVCGTVPDEDAAPDQD